MKSKRNLIPIHYLSLHDLQETVTFDGISFYDWDRALRTVLKNDEKLSVLKVPVTEPPSLTDKDVSEIVMGTVIPGLQKIFDTNDAYQMYHQINQI